MKILITGVGGFAGLNFLNYFSIDHDVIGTYDPMNSKWLKILKKAFKGIKIHELNIRFPNAIGHILKRDVDVIIHEKALIHAPQSVEKPRLYHDFNVNGFFNILECAREYNTKVVCVGSNISYEEPVYRPIDENHPQNPNSPYGASRVCQEKYALSYYHTFDLPVIVLRYSNLYGPYGEGVINSFVKNALKLNHIFITGGKQTRTYTHIEDAAKATELAIKSKKAIGEIYNVSGDETVDLIFLSDIIKGNFPDIEIKYYDNWKGDILSDQYEISNKKIKTDLGFKPEYNLDIGIKEVIECTKFQFSI